MVNVMPECKCMKFCTCRITEWNGGNVGYIREVTHHAPKQSFLDGLRKYRKMMRGRWGDE